MLENKVNCLEEKIKKLEKKIFRLELQIQSRKNKLETAYVQAIAEQADSSFQKTCETGRKNGVNKLKSVEMLELSRRLGITVRQCYLMKLKGEI